MEGTELCPVCLSEDKSDMVSTPCAHAFCRACIERVIATSKRSDPTKAPCPLCRVQLSVFDLRHAGSGAPLHPRSDDLSALVGRVYTQGGLVGFASYHFEEADGPDSGGRGVNCFLSYESEKVDEAGWQLDNGLRPPMRKAFEDAHWHEPTRTFHAVVRWHAPASWERSEQWDYVMQFSSDMRYICGGSVTMQRSRTCLDGEWTVRWESGEEAQINIDGGHWVLWSARYVLNFSEGENQPFFKWPDQAHTSQRIAITLNPEKCTEVGATILWTTDHPEYPTITWIRQAAIPAKPVEPIVSYYGPDGLRYMNHVAEQQLATPTYQPESLWGNTFVQGLRLGFASLHFVSPDGDSSEDGDITGTYISYEHPHCALLPCLDNGAPVPARMPFDAPIWDPQQRIFRGSIEWGGRLGTSWQGATQWRYEIEFDPSFLFVVRGTVQITLQGEVDPSQTQNLGQQIAYINAGANAYLHRLVDGANPEDESLPSPERMLQAAADSGASPRTMSQLHALANAVQQQTSRPEPAEEPPEPEPESGSEPT